MGARALSALAVAFLLAGCASLYFEPAARAPGPAPQYRLEAWPEREYWSGLVFNGEKIGFSHLALAPAAQPGHFEIRSEAAFALRFLFWQRDISAPVAAVTTSDARWGPRRAPLFGA